MATGKRCKRQTLSQYAKTYCPWGLSGRKVVGSTSARAAFKRELTLGNRRHMPLLTVLKRMGWHPGRTLTPSMRRLIEKRLGEP